MSTFVLDPAPTFKAPVEIPIHGGATAKVVFEFRHRTRDELDEFVKKSQSGELKGADEVLAMACGWDLPNEFNAESVQKLLQNYMGSGAAIATAYLNEIWQVRLGN